MINSSVVLYNNSILEIEKLTEVIDRSCIEKNYLIDNSSKKLFKHNFNKSQLITSNVNIGFGSAHNIAFEKSFEEGVKYHIIINPDIEFKEDIIQEIIKYMDENPYIGVVMPKIIYPDDRIQRLAKLIPSPLEYFARRFIPFNWIKNRINNRYELITYDYTYPLDAPFLSGCFLVFRVDVLEKIGGFDEKIFLYFEDNDICRKILKEGYRTVVYPFVSVVHDHTPKSFFNLKNIIIYFKSGIYYFNKWGWIFDKDRKKRNKNTLTTIYNHNKLKKLI
jgi:GT2 family glycosyltransferase